MNNCETSETKRLEVLQALGYATLEEYLTHCEWVERRRVHWQELLDYQNSDEARERKAKFPGVNIVFVYPRKL
jgi:hypothetical protein